MRYGTKTQFARQTAGGRRYHRPQRVPHQAGHRLSRRRLGRAGDRRSGYLPRGRRIPHL